MPADYERRVAAVCHRCRPGPDAGRSARSHSRAVPLSSDATRRRPSGLKLIFDTSSSQPSSRAISSRSRMSHRRTVRSQDGDPLGLVHVPDLDVRAVAHGGHQAAVGGEGEAGLAIRWDRSPMWRFQLRFFPDEAIAGRPWSGRSPMVRWTVSARTSQITVSLRNGTRPRTRQYPRRLVVHRRSPGSLGLRPRMISRSWKVGAVRPHTTAQRGDTPRTGVPPLLFRAPGPPPIGEGRGPTAAPGTGWVSGGRCPPTGWPRGPPPGGRPGCGTGSRRRSPGRPRGRSGPTPGHRRARRKRRA